MKRVLAIGSIGVGVMFVLAGLGHGAVPASPKIAVIDMQNTFDTTPAGKRAAVKFDAIRKAKQVEVDKLQDDFKKKASELDKQASSGVLKDSVVQQRRAKLQEDYLALEQQFMKKEDEIAEARRKILFDLRMQAGPKIEALAKAEGVQLVLERGGGVLWMDPSLDLTARLNAEMK